MNDRTKEKIKTLGHDITELFNTMTLGKERGEIIVEELINAHPTLQQNIMRYFIVLLIEAWASKEYSDARNEATVKACRELVKTIKDKELYFPYI